MLGRADYRDSKWVVLPGAGGITQAEYREFLEQRNTLYVTIIVDT